MGKLSLDLKRLKLSHVEVKSSNVKSIAYSYRYELLEVKFHNGGTYRYRPVSATTYAGFATCESIGRYLREEVINVKSIQSKRMD